MTPEDLTNQVAWRNLAVQWHLDNAADCGCDDDTADEDLCPASVDYADRMFSTRIDPIINGPEDPWNHDIWKAAWGRNAPLIASASDYRLPMAPSGQSWLVRRLLVGGRQVIELNLFALGEHAMTTVARARVPAEPTTVHARARQMLQDTAA